MDENFDEVATLRAETAQLLAVKEMTTMPGWVIVVSHFTQVIQTVTDQLLIEEDSRKVRRLQERIRAFKSMLQDVASLCEQHSETMARLESIELDNNERDEYGL